MLCTCGLTRPKKKAHEAAIHTAKMRHEITQSRAEQKEYLKNVELSRVLEKRIARKKEKGEEMMLKPNPPAKRKAEGPIHPSNKRPRTEEDKGKLLDSVLGSIF
jgi:ESF2/ABP1 family protein